MKYPKILTTETVVLNPGIEKFILKGSNVMWDGISNTDDLDVAADETVAIKDSKGNLIAIGAYMMDEVPEDGEGKEAIFILNF
jgi:predicted RNA-binding protein (TIGR00451 family)